MVGLEEVDVAPDVAQLVSARLHACLVDFGISSIALELHAAGVTSLNVLRSMNIEEEAELIEIVRVSGWGPGHRCLLRELVSKARSNLLCGNCSDLVPAMSSVSPRLASLLQRNGVEGLERALFRNGVATVQCLVSLDPLEWNELSERIQAIGLGPGHVCALRSIVGCVASNFVLPPELPTQSCTSLSGTDTCNPSSPSELDQAGRKQALSWYRLSALTVAAGNIQRMEAWARPDSASASLTGISSQLKQARLEAEADVESSGAMAELRGVAAAYSTLVLKTSGQDFPVGIRRACQDSLRTLRDAVVWCVAKHIDITDGAAFQEALVFAFGREATDTTRDLFSQLKLSFHKIMSDCPRAFRSKSSQLSPLKRLRRARRRPAKPQSDLTATSDTTCADKCAAQTISTHQSADIAAAPSMPSRVGINIGTLADGLGITHQIRVHNTFLETASECSSSVAANMKPKSWPGGVKAKVEGGVARLSLEVFPELAQKYDADENFISCDVISLATGDVAELVPDIGAALGAVYAPLAQICEECKSEDPNCWQDPSGRFYCGLCWLSWKQTRYKDVETASVDLTKMSSHPRCVIYEQQLDPICDAPQGNCEIFFKPCHCIDFIASEPNACLVALGSTMIIDSCLATSNNHIKGILPMLCRASNFAEIANQVYVPRYGAVYSPEVEFVKDSNGRLLSSGFTSAVLYAGVPYGPDGYFEVDHDYLGELRAKLQNVFRICFMQKHTKLLIVSRFTSLRPVDVVRTIKELLRQPEEHWGFESITFAINPDDCRMDLIDAFALEFPVRSQDL